MEYIKCIEFIKEIGMNVLMSTCFNEDDFILLIENNKTYGIVNSAKEFKDTDMNNIRYLRGKLEFAGDTHHMMNYLQSRDWGDDLEVKTFIDSSLIYLNVVG